jgi:hypothetical protein
VGRGRLVDVGRVVQTVNLREDLLVGRILGKTQLLAKRLRVHTVPFLFGFRELLFESELTQVDRKQVLQERPVRDPAAEKNVAMGNTLAVLPLDQEHQAVALDLDVLDPSCGLVTLGEVLLVIVVNVQGNTADLVLHTVREALQPVGSEADLAVRRVLVLTNTHRGNPRLVTLGELNSP